MTFQFVDNNAVIDPGMRRRIRSHVAMGRNAGKTIVRPSRIEAFGPKVRNSPVTLRIPKIVEGRGSKSSEEAIAPELERQVGYGLSVISFPEQLTPGSKGLVQRAFSFISGPRHVPELDNILDTSRAPLSMWVQFMFLDEAYFHCAVAVSVTALNTLTAKQEDPKEAMRHLSQTLHLINERLSRNDAVSNTTIAVVVIMAQYERLQGRCSQGLVHLEGLLRMIKLRGGIRQLAMENPSFAQKIFRADLEYSLNLGSATRFRIGDVIPTSTALFGLPNSFGHQKDQRTSHIFDSHLFRQLSVELRNALIDITGLSWLLNDANDGRESKVDHYSFHDSLLLLGYRLIHIRPLDLPRPINNIENAIHLGLMAFILTFLRGFDRKITCSSRLLHSARLATQDKYGNGKEDQEVLLWLLFIEGGSIFRESDDTWLTLMTARTMHGLSLYTWEDVSRTLVKFPWVNAVHDQPGQKLWLRSTSSYRFPAVISQ